MAYLSLRFFFGTKEAAIDALLKVLRDARETDKDYTIGSLSSEQILSSGLLVYGDVEHLIPTLEEVPEVSFYYD